MEFCLFGKRLRIKTDRFYLMGPFSYRHPQLNEHIDNLVPFHNLIQEIVISSFDPSKLRQDSNNQKLKLQAQNPSTLVLDHVSNYHSYLNEGIG